MLDFDDLLVSGDFAAISALVRAKPSFLNGHYLGRGTVPLVDATEQMKAELVALLIDLGANVNAKDSRGQTAMHTAAINGSPDIAKLLITNQALLNVRDNLGFSPLMWATCGGSDADRLAVARLLLEHGATYDLNSAAYLADVDRVREILNSDQNAVANAPLPNDLLGGAIGAGSLEILRMLLKAGANPNSISGSGDPAIFEAVRGTSRAPEFLDALLNAGTDPRIKHRAGGDVFAFVGSDLASHHEAVFRRHGINK